jgi:4-amino-4-deoxy-L-arabinose transferase-like glycosyltransferase
MLSFLLAFVLVACFALFLSATLRLRSRLVFMISVFLLVYADIVLSIELASLIRRITPFTVMILHIILASAAGLVWWKTGKPDLLGPFKGRLAIWRELPPFRKRPLVYIFGVFVGLAYLGGAVLILATPQNNYDSMTYHLSRVGYWLQHETLYPWDTFNIRQTTFSPNAEIGILWTVLFWGTDQLSGFVQWFGALFAAAATYGLARLIGARRWQSVMVALLLLTFPEVVLQSVTTMNDLIAAAFVASGVYLLFTGWRRGDKTHLWLSGLAFGLAAGVKTYLAFLAPSLLVILILLAWSNSQNLRGKLFHWIAAGLASFILLGAFGYLQNWIYYETPLPLTQTFMSEPKPRWQLFRENAALYSIQAIDLTGLPPAVQATLADYKNRIFLEVKDLPAVQGRQWREWRNQLRRILRESPPTHEDLSWFGPLFLILFIPASIYQLVYAIRRKEPLRLSLLILVLGFYITLSAAFFWSPYRGRYFTLVMPYATALMVPWFSSRRKLAWAQWLIVALSIMVLYQTMLYNRAKPLVGDRVIWGQDAQSIRMNNNNLGMLPVVRAVEKYVPKDGRMAVRLGSDAWDYPLFGQHFQRYILPLGPDLGVDGKWLYDRQIEYLLFERAPGNKPEGFESIWSRDGWVLYRACESVPCPPDRGESRESPVAPENGELISVSPGLVGNVEIIELDGVGWGIEEVEGEEVFWLGEGPYHHLMIKFLSNASQQVKVILEVVAGPAKTNPDRNLKLIMTPQREGRSVVFERAFTSTAVLEFPIGLGRGVYELQIYSVDSAEILQQPNGDTRPLLILVKHVGIEE